MPRVITFGEIMLRLKSPALERFFQSPALEATFGGGEANVAVSLANYGMDAAFVTLLPDNDIGRACLRTVRGYGVDVSNIRLVPGRMGIYFLETGSNQRPSKVIYDRADSCIAKAAPDAIDWDAVFEGATWFHITGITPAISQSAADLSLAAVKAAKAKGLHVSCDLNYRKNLWKYGKRADEVMGELVRYVDTIIANEEDFQKALGIRAESDVESGELDRDVYKTIARTRTSIAASPAPPWTATPTSAAWPSRCASPRARIPTTGRRASTTARSSTSRASTPSPTSSTASAAATRSAAA